jgi:hypothetical protein
MLAPSIHPAKIYVEMKTERWIFFHYNRSGRARVLSLSLIHPPYSHLIKCKTEISVNVSHLQHKENTHQTSTLSMNVNTPELLTVPSSFSITTLCCTAIPWVFASSRGDPEMFDIRTNPAVLMVSASAGARAYLTVSKLFHQIHL